MKAILEEIIALDQRLVALDGTTQALVDGAYKHGSNACHIADQAEAIMLVQTCTSSLKKDVLLCKWHLELQLNFRSVSILVK